MDDYERTTRAYNGRLLILVSIPLVLMGFYGLIFEPEEWGVELFLIVFFGLGALWGRHMIKSAARVPALDQKGSSDFPRFFNFKSVELVRIGTGAARITRVTRQKVEYIDEAGREQFVDLEECARIWMCLERSGLFPPGNETDWAGLADATPEFSKLELSSSDSNTVGLRGALDSPPWFQFLNRRRTQFEFKNGHSFETKLREPLGKVGWQSFDAC